MKPFCCVFAALSFASCAQIKSVTSTGMSKVSGGVTKVSQASKDSFAKLMPARIPVAKVREKDLKPLPTGQEQALAFEKSRRNRFWNIFSGPVDFVEPTLPEESVAMDGELLPPKAE